MEGYDFEVNGDAVPEYVCPVCLQLLRNSVLLSCSHSACKNCLMKWEEQNSGNHKCPSCQVPYEREKIYEGKQGKFIDRVITTSLKVKCKQYLRTCKWVGTISDYQIHEKRCEFLQVACNYHGCTMKVSRRDLPSHEKECEYRNIECKFCAALMSINEYEDHLSSCGLHEVICPVINCREKIKRKDLNAHIQHSFGFSEVPCGFQELGCTCQIMRKDFPNQLNSSMQSHMNLLVQESLNSRNSIKELKQSNERLNQQLQELQQPSTGTGKEQLCTGGATKPQSNFMMGSQDQQKPISVEILVEKINALESKMFKSEKKVEELSTLVNESKKNEERNNEKLMAAMRLTPEDCTRDWSVYHLNNLIEGYENQKFTAIIILRPELASLSNPYGSNLLHYAARFNNHSAADVLAKNGCDVTFENNWGNQPIHSAAVHGAVDVARKLFISNPALVNTRNTQNNKTPLHLAVENSQANFVKFLLKRGSIDVEARDVNNKKPEDYSRQENIKRLFTQYQKLSVNK